MKTDRFGIKIPPRPPCGNLVTAIDNLEADRMGMMKKAKACKNPKDKMMHEAIAHGMWLAQIHLGIST